MIPIPIIIGAAILIGAAAVAIYKAATKSADNNCSSATSAGSPGAGCPNKISRVPGMDADKADKAIEQALKDQQKMLSDKIKALERWDEKDKAQFKKWFGANDDKTRDIVKERLKKSLEHSKSYKPENFEAGDPEFIKKNPTVFAYVTKDNPDKIYLGPSFATAPATGTDSKAGTIGHEMTHFNKIAGTDDVVYGQKKSLQLAKDNPADALRNADSHEYYLEEGS